MQLVDLYDTRLRIGWGTFCALGTAAFIAVEAVLWNVGLSSPLAPNPAIFVACLAGGTLCGVLGAIAERHQLLHHRDELSQFHRLPTRERFRWPVVRRNLQRSGWFLAVLYALMGCCWFWQANFFPPLLAASAVMGFANQKLSSDFHRQFAATAA
jgi:hypothetical protein